MTCKPYCSLCFFNDAAATVIYTLSLHDALPISSPTTSSKILRCWYVSSRAITLPRKPRSEEHTSELQSLTKLVCRLLLEKKKTGHRAAGTRNSRTSQSRRCAFRTSDFAAPQACY